MDVGNFAPEADAVDGHPENPKDADDSCDGAHGGSLRHQPKGPYREEQAKQTAYGDKYDVESSD
jgi:hypothetical protein